MGVWIMTKEELQKEADFAETKMLINCNGDYSKKKDYKKGWQDGAEFGYNKANEWHYVKNGDLPKDEDWKWCVSYRGYYYVAKYEEIFGCWTNQEYSEVMKPYAWKEIVLPKLPKEASE
jgi:hypothetical protein